MGLEAEAIWQPAQAQVALRAALRHLPEPQQVILVAHGLHNELPQSLAVIGHEYSVSREWVRQ